MDCSSRSHFLSISDITLGMSLKVIGLSSTYSCIYNSFNNETRNYLCSNFQVFAGIFTRCPTCQRAHIYHFCSFCIRCHICHFPIAIWSQNLGIGTIFEPNLPLKTGCNKFQMESVKMKKATKTMAFRQLAIYCNIVGNHYLFSDTEFREYLAENIVVGDFACDGAQVVDDLADVFA